MPDISIGPVDYSSNIPPAGYTCERCGISRVKLWSTTSGRCLLACASCAAQHQRVEISGILADGTRPTKDGWINTIGSLIPAIPTPTGTTLYSYTDRPLNAYDWWERLPV